MPPEKLPSGSIVPPISPGADSDMEEALKITENPLVDNVGEEDVMPFEIKGGGGDGESIPKNDAAKETAAKGTLAKKMQNSPRNRNRKPVLLLIYFCGLGIVAFGVYSVALNDAEEVSNDTKSVNKFSIGLTRAFFDEACLIDMRNSTKKTSNNDDDDDDPLRIVNDYMGPFIESLSIVNVLKSCVQLLIHFALQQAGGVLNPNQEVRGYKWVGKFLWALWVSFLIGSVASTITSLVVSFLSYGSLEMQYRKCMMEMESGDAFLNVVAPVFPLLPPFSGKIAGIAGGIFVLLQGIGVLKSLTPAQVGSWEVRLLAPLVGPLGIISVGYFYVTLSWIFSGLLFWPIPLVLCFVCICAWKAMIVTMAWLKDQSKYVENEAADRKKAAAATAATIEGGGGGDDQEQGAVSQAITAVEHDVAEAVKQKVEPCSFVLRHGIDGYLVFWADSFAQTSLWWVQRGEDGGDDEPEGIFLFVFLAGWVTLWPFFLVFIGFGLAGFDEDNHPMAPVFKRIFRLLNTLVKSNTMTCLAFCGIAALCMGPFVTLSTWAAFAAYAGSTAADWGAFVGECYAAAFDFGGIGLPAFSFDFSALADLDVTFNSIIPEFDVVSPAEVLRASKALDAASVVFSICKVLVTLGSWILSLQDAYGDNLVISDLAAGQADIGYLVRTHATWPELQTAINRAFSEELVSLATGDDEAFFEFILTKDKDYPGNLNATDFGQCPLDLIVVLKLYEELEGDIGDLLPGCVNLRVFVVAGNKKLTGDIQVLENCPNMTETDFSDCSNIEGGCCSLEECSSLSFLRPSPHLVPRIFLRNILRIFKSG